MDASGSKIKVTKNGPYIVTGDVPLTREEIVVDDAGESVAWKVTETLTDASTRVLCRCGRSNAKPCCDGTHELVSFDGTETAALTPYAESAHRIVGPRVTLLDEPVLCADARFCAAKGTAWKRVLEDDEESAAVATEEARLCPSGRYTAEDPSCGVIEPELNPSIALVEDPHEGVAGPLWVKGGIPVVSADGTAYEVRNRVTLCRCGKSTNKPFCCGAHIEAGFTDR